MTESFISDEEFSLLTNAFLSLKTESEMKSFLTDICTVKEIQEIAMRLSVARELHRGKNYIDIGKKTGASSATISRVSRCLRCGNNGYYLVFTRMGEKVPETAMEACSNGLGITQ